MSTYALTNANTGKVEKTFDTLASSEVPGLIDTAHKAYLSWKK